MYLNAEAEAQISERRARFAEVAADGIRPVEERIQEMGKIVHSLTESFCNYTIFGGREAAVDILKEMHDQVPPEEGFKAVRVSVAQSAWVVCQYNYLGS